ncbi:Transglycosylase SLT domain protein [Parageobacillus caldoxylosilyticus]|uniref:transglycosylase SLT domain-containing protein n=1 Tax=Saccharococcus caldoxylosilyticus TaxID=81408 RepID=UPI001C4E1F5A|nr:transglycosylase SLT domain-containing protein [Parageobacillus caldoxylosilyticus]QXJ39592.1 Transglycosylase SLT domain protein [Parageobacillus caldoxylosilyticus]
MNSLRELVVSVVLNDKASRPLREIQQSTNRVRDIFTQFGKQSSKTNEQVSRSVQRMGKAYSGASNLIRNALNNLSSRMRHASSEARSFQSSIESTRNSLSRFSNGADNAISSLKRMAAGALGAVSAYQALSKAIGEAARFEQSKVLIEAMFDDKKASDAYMKMLERVAVNSPVLNSQDMFANSKSFISLSKNVKVLEQAWKVVEKLNVMDPAQGVEGAVLALRELASGDVVSLVERFELPRSAVKAIKDLPFEQQVKAMDKLLTKMNITDKVVQKMGNTTISQWGRFKEMTSIAFRNAGKSANSELGTALQRVNNILEKGALNNFVQSADKFLGKSVNAIVNFGIAAKQFIQPAAQFFRENASSIKAVAAALGSLFVIRKVTSLVQGLFMVLRANPLALAITGIVVAVDKLVGIETVFNKIKLAYQGLKAAFGGDQQKSVSFLQKLGLSPEQAQQVIGIVQKIKSMFDTVGKAVGKFVNEVVIPLLPQAKQFIVSSFEAVRPSLRFVVGLFHTVIDVIKTLVQKVVVPLFPTIKDVISTAFRVVTPIIKIANRAFQAVASIVMFLVNNVVIPLIPKIVPAIQSMWKIVGPILKGIAKMFDLISDAIEWTITKFGQFIKAAKDLPGKIGSGIKSMAGKAMSGVTHLINSLLGGLAKGINGVTGGINWVLGKIGVKTRIPKWEPPKYARGTDYHPGGLAIVGDGGGPELIRTPSGQIGLSPARSTLTYLPRGTEVLPHRETQALLESGLFPAYKDGAGNGLLHRASAILNKAKDIALDVWSYITKPSELMKKVWEKLGVSAPNISGAFGEIGKRALSLIKDKALGFVKKKLEGFLSFGSGGKVSGNVAQWVRAAMAITGVPASWFHPLVAIAMKESGGNPRAINLWDINAKRGTPSKGLFQTIDPTFNRYKLPGLNDIWNPVHNAVAAIRYMIDRYGSVFNVPGIRNMMRGRGYVGYRQGGIATKPQIAALAESGWKEFIIPTEPRMRNRALALLAQANAELGYNPSGGKTLNRSNAGGNISIEFSPKVDIHVYGTDMKEAGSLEAAVNRKLEEMWQMFLDIYPVEVVR